MPLMLIFNWSSNLVVASCDHHRRSFEGHYRSAMRAPEGWRGCNLTHTGMETFLLVPFALVPTNTRTVQPFHSGPVDSFAHRKSTKQREGVATSEQTPKNAAQHSGTERGEAFTSFTVSCGPTPRIQIEACLKMSGFAPH